jgi:hypothetical protein
MNVRYCVDYKTLVINDTFNDISVISQ